MFKFKQIHSLSSRQKVFDEISLHHSDRIPVIVERLPGNTLAPMLQKRKFLVPRTTKMGRFMMEVRRNLPSLRETDALYFYVDSTMVPVSLSMEEIYDRHKDEDGFLYVHYAMENTFG